MQRCTCSRSLLVMKVRITENSPVAKLAAARLKADHAAIVFGNTIHLHNIKREEFLTDKAWVCHELQHVKQYNRYGFTGFLFRYTMDWIRKGYYNNRFEAEARNAEQCIELLNGVEFI